MRHIVAHELGPVGLEYIQADFDKWLYRRDSQGGYDSVFFTVPLFIHGRYHHPCRIRRYFSAADYPTGRPRAGTL